MSSVIWSLSYLCETKNLETLNHAQLDIIKKKRRLGVVVVESVDSLNQRTTVQYGKRDVIIGTKLRTRRS